MSVIRFTYDRIARRLQGGLIRIPVAGRWSAPQWLVSACVYGWFALVVVWFVGEMFFGCGVNADEYYMALCCRDYANQPIAMLTFYGGWLATRIFGDQIITLRLLGCFCVLVGVGVPAWYCYRKTRSPRWALFIVTCVLVAVRSQWIRWYGWDIGPVMYDGVLITFVISLYDRLATWKVVGVGALAALTVLARVPSAIVVVPVCFAALWYATRGIPMRGRRYWRCAGIGTLSFLLTFLLCVTVMKGSPEAYVASWRPENIITGHGVKEISFFWRYVKHDAPMLLTEIWVAKYSLVSIAVLCLFSSRCRYVPAIILMGYLFYRKLMLPNSMCVPRLALNMAMILFPFLYNLKSRLLGEKSYIRVDMRKFFIILVFGLVLVIGSDRLILRVCYYVMFPLLLVPLYPVRRGMVFWTMLFLTLPSFVYGVYDRVRKIPDYQRMEEILPFHRYIMEGNISDFQLSQCGVVMDVLNHEERRISTFSIGRYAVSYLYEKEVPYRLNTFHFYSDQEFISAMDDFTSAYDIIVMEDCEELYPIEKQISMMRKRNFYVTALPGNNIVFERLEPRQFLSVADAAR